VGKRVVPGDCEDRALDVFLGLAKSEAELREMIAFLIEHRSLLKEDALLELEGETHRLLGQLGEVTRSELLAELQCFKDTLALHRRLLDEGREG
jgi:hypothetical protein